MSPNVRPRPIGYEGVSPAEVRLTEPALEVTMTFKEWWVKTFGPDGLFSTAQEGHAFLIGICETIAFWKPRWNMPADYEAWFKHGDTHKPGNPLYEYHYYMFGRACGVLVWIWLIALLKLILL